MSLENYNDIPREKFAFAGESQTMRGEKPQSPPVGYFKDAWRRFRKNRASIVGACIILFLILFSLAAPLFSSYRLGFSDTVLRNRIPKIGLLARVGIATGSYEKALNEKAFAYYEGIGIGASYDPALDTEDISAGVGGHYSPIRAVKSREEKSATVQMDAYYEIGFQYMIVTQSEYHKIRAYEEETGTQVLYPMVDTAQEGLADSDDANSWYETQRGLPVLAGDGSYRDLYLRDAQGNVRYFVNSDKSSLKIRVLYASYFVYTNGTEAAFPFGSNAVGQDILIRLAAAIRLSLLLSLGVSVLNLAIGTIFGMIEGYYGGKTDLILERLVDILSGVPFIIVASLFQLYLANKVGMVTALLFAFVITGWIGIASRVRSQFYRFKNQEYVLSARTLGPGDLRLMFRHIFPNTLGTIITSSALIIPGVIFSESMLSYLGIVNLRGAGTASLGTMLSDGQTLLSSYPHVLFFPAMVISLLMISFNLFGNGLRDAFNPSLRGVEE